MKQYTDHELEQNYNKFMGIIEKVFSGERLEKLQHMYSMEQLGSNLILSPASGTKGFHSTYDGGYIDHVMNVAKHAMSFSQLFVNSGGVKNYTDEELIFSALHHDLGKLGKVGMMGYVKNPSDWHVQNQGKIYIPNPDLPYMSHTDRTFQTLQEFGIKISDTEWYGIKLTDGIYDEDNMKYLKSFKPGISIPTNLPYVLHWADHMSTVVERYNDLIEDDGAPF